MKSLPILAFFTALAAVAHGQDSAATGSASGSPAPTVTLVYRDVPVIHPSSMGVVIGRHDPYFGMSLNQGAELRLARWFKLGAAYSGVFGYRSDSYEGPFIAEYHNPTLFVAISGTGGSPIWSIPAGWGHESNGGFINSRQKFQGVTGLKVDSCLQASAPCKDNAGQDYADMGWDYIWIRGFMTNATPKNRHELVFNGSIEYRMYMQEQFGFGEDKLKDSAVFINTKNPIGYRHYDGVRLSLGASYENIAFQAFGKVGTETPVYGSMGAQLSYRLPEEVRKTYPVEPYISFETGYALSLGRYFEDDTKFGIGVIIRNPVIHALYD